MSSIVCELPPEIRNAAANMVTHFIYGSSTPCFETFLPIYSDELNNLLKEGLKINNIHFKIRILGLIADAPARAKITFAKQYNGKFGCFFCINPGVRINGKRIYKFNPQFKIRTNELYKDQALRAKRSGKPYHGIFGEAYLSKWIKMPDDVIADQMHMIMEGVVKRLILLWFDSKSIGKKCLFGNL